MKKLTSPLLALFLFSTFSLNAQLNYKKGFLITNSGDTVKGFINDGGEIRNARICLYKSAKRSKPIKYTPESLSFYMFEGDKHYVAIPVPEDSTEHYYFAEILVEGPLSLYFCNRNNEMKYFLKTEDDSLVGLLNKKVELPVASGGLYKVVNQKRYTPLVSSKIEDQLNTDVYAEIYKDTLYSIFLPKKELVNEIPSLNYSHRSLMGITRAYNSIGCAEANCNQYVKDLRTRRPRFGLYTGWQLVQWTHWTSKGDYGEKNADVSSKTFYNVPFGIFCDFPLTQFSQKLTFRLEMSGTKFNFNQDSVQLPDSFSFVTIRSARLNFPVSLHYRFTNQAISPTIGIGKEFGLIFNSKVYVGDNNQFELYKNSRGGWFIDLGADWKIIHGLGFFTEIRLSTFRELFISNQGTTNRGSYQDVVENQAYDMYHAWTAAIHAGIRF